MKKLLIAALLVLAAVGCGTSTGRSVIVVEPDNADSHDPPKCIQVATKVIGWDKTIVRVDDYCLKDK